MIADTETSNYQFVKPESGGSPNTWGNKLNANTDDIDTLVFDLLLAVGSNVSNTQTFRNNIGMATVSQSEAQAGTATTVRAWTAQRMRQSIVAYAAPISHTHPVADISGVLADARIPSLNASKFNAGVFNSNRIPNLNTSKATAGTLPSARGGTGETSVAGYRGIYTGTADDNLNFPVGSYVVRSTESGQTEPNRNQTSPIYLANNNAYFYTRLSASGVVLSGEWRSRGRIRDGGTFSTAQHLMQRVF